MAKLTDEKIALKLKGATDEDIEFLFSKPELATEELREAYKQSFNSTLVDRKKDLAKAQKNYDDAHALGAQYEKLRQKLKKEYTELILKDVLALKSKGKEVNLDNYRDLFNPEKSLFSAKQIETINQTEAFDMSEYIKYKSATYTATVLKEDVIKPLTYTEISDLFYADPEKQYKHNLDSKGKKIPNAWDKVDEKALTADEVYDKLYEIKKRDYDSSLQKDDYESVLDVSEIVNFKEKMLFFGELGFSPEDFERVAPRIKRLREIENQSDLFEYAHSELNSSEHKNLVRDYEEHAKVLADNIKNNQDKQKELLYEMLTATNEASPFNNKEKELNEFSERVSRITARLDANIVSKGEEFYKGEVIGEYQNKLAKYNKFSNSEKKAHKDMKEELDAYASYFERNNIDANEPRFTRQEKVSIGNSRVALDKLREDKKAYKDAYEKENKFVRFIGSFFPNSWTNLGKMRDKIAEREKNIKDLFNVTDLAIEKYDHFIEAKENEFVDNQEALNKIKVNAFDRYATTENFNDLDNKKIVDDLLGIEAEEEDINKNYKITRNIINNEPNAASFKLNNNGKGKIQRIEIKGENDKNNMKLTKDDLIMHENYDVDEKINS